MCCSTGPHLKRSQIHITYPSVYAMQSMMFNHLSIWYGQSLYMGVQTDPLLHSILYYNINDDNLHKKFYTYWQYFCVFVTICFGVHYTTVHIKGLEIYGLLTASP